MKRAGLLIVAAVVIAGCSQNTTSPPPDSPEPSVALSTPAPSPTSVAPTQAATTPAATPTQTKPPATPAPGTDAFCAYLKKTAGAQQRVEDPQQFVDLVDGALAVAPGAIQEDLALYAQSVRKLALTVTGSPAEAAKADAWLTRNEDAINQAEANLDAYSQSTCGRPFITGEG
ncbi:MAG: hypothetical protein U0R23_08105 [Candidatus Nanopelagicales bacterium]